MPLQQFFFGPVNAVRGLIDSLGKVLGWAIKVVVVIVLAPIWLIGRILCFRYIFGLWYPGLNHYPKYTSQDLKKVYEEVVLDASEEIKLAFDQLKDAVFKISQGIIVWPFAVIGLLVVSPVYCMQSIFSRAVSALTQRGSGPTGTPVATNDNKKDSSDLNAKSKNHREHTQTNESNIDWFVFETLMFIDSFATVIYCSVVFNGWVSLIALGIWFVATFEIFFAWDANERDRREPDRGEPDDITLGRATKHNLRYKALIAFGLFAFVFWPVLFDRINQEFDAFSIPDNIAAGSLEAFLLWLLYLRDIILDIYDANVILGFFGATEAPVVPITGLGTTVSLVALLSLGYLVFEAIRENLLLGSEIEKELTKLRKRSIQENSTDRELVYRIKKLAGQADRIPARLIFEIKKQTNTKSIVTWKKDIRTMIRALGEVGKRHYSPATLNFLSSLLQMEAEEIRAITSKSSEQQPADRTPSKKIEDIENIVCSTLNTTNLTYKSWYFKRTGSKLLEDLLRSGYSVLEVGIDIKSVRVIKKSCTTIGYLWDWMTSSNKKELKELKELFRNKFLKYALEKPTGFDDYASVRPNILRVFQKIDPESVDP